MIPKTYILPKENLLAGLRLAVPVSVLLWVLLLALLF